MNEKLSISPGIMHFYIHIPFCRSKCPYCSFSSFAGNSKSAISGYIRILRTEIDESLRKHELKNISTLYFGGGTPSLLTKGQLDALIEPFRDLEGFRNAEITIEANPQDIDDVFLSSITRAGANRLSVGVQSLQEPTLKAIGRAPKASIFLAFDRIRRSGFSNVGVDFILGLPHSERGRTLEDIDELSSVSPFIRHVSVYMLEAGNYPASWESISLNDEDFEAEYELVRSGLEKSGFVRYELSNFSKPGFECLHNKAYWSHREYLGFGLGAASFYRGKRFQNARNFKQYARGILEYEETLSEEDLKTERKMFGIRTGGLEVADIQDLRMLEALRNEQLIRVDGGRIILTPKGVVLADTVLARLL